MLWDLFRKKETFDPEREAKRLWEDIGAAQFSAIKAHLTAYDQATDRPTILRLLDPVQFVRLAEQAVDQCAGLVVAYVGRAVDSLPDTPAVRVLRPDAEDRAALGEMLLATLDHWVEPLRRYAATYQAFAQVASDNSVWSNALAWGQEGGELAEALFGTTGGLLGGLLGGFFAGRRHNAALAAAGERFDADFLALRQAYDASMEAMRERIAVVLAAIAEKIDAALASPPVGNHMAMRTNGAQVR